MLPNAVHLGALRSSVGSPRVIYRVFTLQGPDVVVLLWRVRGGGGLEQLEV